MGYNSTKNLKTDLTDAPEIQSTSCSMSHLHRSEGKLRVFTYSQIAKSWDADSIICNQIMLLV